MRTCANRQQYKIRNVDTIPGKLALISFLFMLVVLAIVFTEKDKRGLWLEGKGRQSGIVTASLSSGHLNSLEVLGKEKAVLCMNKSMMDEHVQLITAVCDKSVGNN